MDYNTVCEGEGWHHSRGFGEFFQDHLKNITHVFDKKQRYMGDLPTSSFSNIGCDKPVDTIVITEGAEAATAFCYKRKDGVWSMVQDLTPMLENAYKRSMCTDIRFYRDGTLKLETMSNIPGDIFYFFEPEGGLYVLKNTVFEPF